MGKPAAAPVVQTVELQHISDVSFSRRPSKYNDDAISISSDVSTPVDSPSPAAGGTSDPAQARRAQRRRRLRIGLLTAAGIVTVLVVLLFFIPMSPVSIWAFRNRALRDDSYFSRATTVDGVSSGDGGSGSSDDGVATLANWMGALSDDAVLTDIYLPGTHDSVARYGGPDYACQSLNLTQQLQIGVRFLDIRLYMASAANSTLTGRHGRVDQGVTWTDVLDAARGFLKANPTELVVLKVQQEASNSSGFATALVKPLAQYPIAQAFVPQSTALSELRGKILLLARGFSLPSPASSTSSSAATASNDTAPASSGYFGLPYGGLDTQDDFKTDLDTKRSLIVNFAQQSATTSSSDASAASSASPSSSGLTSTSASGGSKWAVNYLSLHNKVEPPALAAESLNALVVDVTTLQPPTRPQVVVLDFPSRHALEVVVDANFVA